MGIIWLVVFLVFGLFSEHFLTWRTLGTLANRIPALAVVAAGMTLVLISGGIDLSVGWCWDSVGQSSAWRSLIGTGRCGPLWSVPGSGFSADS
jgi:ribose/xylose/arabinose/galactoside ABC-type transport system permease subunit